MMMLTKQGHKTAATKPAEYVLGKALDDERYKSLCHTLRLAECSLRWLRKTIAELGPVPEPSSECEFDSCSDKLST